MYLINKSKKQIISILLVICMFFPMLPVKAVETGTSEVIESTEANEEDAQDDTETETATENTETEVDDTEATADNTETTADDTGSSEINEDIKTPMLIQPRIAGYTVSGDLSGTYAHLADAVDAINGHSGTDFEILGLGEETLTTSITFNIGKNVVLKAIGAPLRLNSCGGTNFDVNDRHFFVSGSLVMDNVILDGQGKTGGVKMYHVTSSYTMKSGQITNVINDETLGGGAVQATVGLFTMEGGIINDNVNLNNEGGGVQIRYNGKFKMTGGTICHNSAKMWGGGVYISGGTFHMQGGEISENTSKYAGGLAQVNGSIVMEGGIISNNHAQKDSNGDGAIGGGIFQTGGVFMMKGGKICDNVAASGSGGGVVVVGGSFTMEGGEISRNIADSNGNGGGGVMLYTTATFLMKGGKICNNQAYKGGGVSIYTNTARFIMEGGELIENTAYGRGGGVFTDDYSYTDPALMTDYPTISITSPAIVKDNKAGSIFNPPSNAQDFNTRATMPLDGALLDNYNVHYWNPKTFVKYHSNSSSNKVVSDSTPYDVYQSVTVLDADTLDIKPESGYKFKHWSTKADDSGVSYAPGKTFPMPSGGNHYLYAIWESLYTLTYDTNGGHGGPGKILNLAAQLDYSLDQTNHPTHSAVGGSEVIFRGWTETADSHIYGTDDVVPNTVTKVNISASKTVYAVWGYKAGNGGGGGTVTPPTKSYAITEKHMSGTKVLSTYTRTVNEGDSYTGSIDQNLLKEYIYTGYKIDNNAEVKSTTKLPSLSQIKENYTVILQYSPVQYKVTVTYEYHADDGSITKLPGSETAMVTKGSTFTPKIPSFKQKTQTGWTLDDKKQTGNPVIKGITQSATIVLIYKQDISVPAIQDYTVTVKAITKDGKTIPGKGYQVTRESGQSFYTAPLVIKDHSYVEWRLDGVVQKSKSIEVAKVTKSITITLVYKKEVGKVPNNTKTVKKENYEFIKMPNVKLVEAGQEVRYTFAGFGNKWGKPLERYAISDRPDKGLDFVSAKLPAFKQSAGVKYNIMYFTNRHGERFLATNIPANQAYTCNAPKLAAGEYITAITFEFGTVPAGFGLGDTIELTFRVWNKPPAKKLTNIGVLSYKVNGQNKEVTSGYNNAAVVIDGYFDPPKTGDSLNIAMIYITLGASFITTVGTVCGRRKKKQYR